MNKYFEKIYTENKDMVYHIAYNTVKNRVDAEDVTIEVFCKLYTALKAQNNIHNISRWLSIVSKTTAIDIIRKNSIKHYEQIETYQHDFSDSIINKVFASKLLNDLYCKNPKWLEYISMRYLLEMSYAEIAAATNQTEAAVKNAVSRAKKYIVQKFKGSNIDMIYSIILIIIFLFTIN